MGQAGGTDENSAQPATASAAAGYKATANTQDTGNRPPGGSGGNRDQSGTGGKSAQETDDGLTTLAGAAGDSARDPSSSQAGDSETDQANTACTVSGSCTSSKCSDQHVSCAIESTGVACEFEGFVGASTDVTCGERAVVGTACCGGCGCVPVEVFFDGSRCWQGVPQCTGLDQFSNKFFDPHAPGTKDGNFTRPDGVPGTFFLGSGGIGGSSAADAGAGDSNGGTAGAGGSGAAGSSAGNTASFGGASDSGAAGASGEANEVTLTP